jgi:hypothetical protein
MIASHAIPVSGLRLLTSVTDGNPKLQNSAVPGSDCAHKERCFSLADGDREMATISGQQKQQGNLESLARKSAFK